ncbi:hypothetical protein AAFC00_005318 [Neodothiora populina]|uniref:2',3'-cyclic-nucleotide 3'-phosphodiesterase n=1 Tax=Neodothiora populina TaxID=2781224 RepID=A0ABR3PKI1_9PEZI
MPGASLWIIPPPDSHFSKIIQSLITTTIPTSHFPHTETHTFIPHVTITSDIPLNRLPLSKAPQSATVNDEPDFQAWLGNLHLDMASTDEDEESIAVALERLEAGDAFTKKLTIKCEKSASLLSLAASCRAQAVDLFTAAPTAARGWATEQYLPHMSLMYASLPTPEVREQIEAIQQDVHNASRHLSTDDQGVVATGGSLVLVDTSKPISQWQIVAERELPQLRWMSPWAKSGFDD